MYGHAFFFSGPGARKKKLWTCWKVILGAMGSYFISAVFPQVSYADFGIFNSFDFFFAKGKLVVPDELKDFPLLTDHYNRVRSLPNIKTWLKERPVTDM